MIGLGQSQRLLSVGDATIEGLGQTDQIAFDRQQNDVILGAWGGAVT